MSALPFAYAWRWKGGVTWKLTLTKNPNAHEGIEIKELFDHIDRSGLAIEQQAEIERLRGALKRCLNFIENTESELGIALDSGDAARAALEVKP